MNEVVFQPLYVAARLPHLPSMPAERSSLRPSKFPSIKSATAHNAVPLKKGRALNVPVPISPLPPPFQPTEGP